MCDPVGASLGALGLIGLFKATLEVWEFVDAGRRRVESFDRLRNKLDNHRACFLWGQRMGFGSPKGYDERLNGDFLRPRNEQTLLHMQQIFLDTDVLVGRYGIKVIKKDAATSTMTIFKAPKPTKAAIFQSEFERLLDRVRGGFMNNKNNNNNNNSDINSNTIKNKGKGGSEPHQPVPPFIAPFSSDPGPVLNPAASSSSSSYVQLQQQTSSQSTSVSTYSRSMSSDQKQRQPSTTTFSSASGSTPATNNQTWHKSFKSRFISWKRSIRVRQKQTTAWKVTMWSIRDEKKFDSLVRELRDHISDLEQLTSHLDSLPDVADVVRETVERISNPQDLQSSHAAAADNGEIESVISSAASVRLLKLGETPSGQSSSSQRTSFASWHTAHSYMPQYSAPSTSPLYQPTPYQELPQQSYPQAAYRYQPQHSQPYSQLSYQPQSFYRPAPGIHEIDGY